MVDFTKLRESKGQPLPTDPFQVFKRLPKPPHINDLWESQSRVLEEWAKRRAEKDLVVKLNTGGGKTLVGLLIAQSLLNELHAPSLYLCANNQLVGQTLEKAEEVGLLAMPYRRGEDLPADFLNAKGILVGSYQALFNGLSKFGVRGSGRREIVKLGCIVCDDAHTAFGTLRDVFTISVKREEQSELYFDLVNRFRADFDEVGRIGTFDDIVERSDLGVLEVPYWAWKAKADQIREKLAREFGDVYKFHLPLLRDNFDNCHALISARDFAVTSIHPLVDLFPSFEECPRRIYMSATIADDSSIVRTFGAHKNASLKPISPPSLAGVGERMILMPSLMAIEDVDAVAVTKEIGWRAVADSGVVVLVPSESMATEWEDFGRVVLKDDVSQAVKSLVDGSNKGPFVFANRYDGIDLAGDACRLLVLDGLPRGATTYDLYRAEVLQGNSSINVGLAQRIEQGLGRATRGAGDYCVVFLVGRDLVSWITRVECLGLITASTKTQILLGHEISKAISSSDELNTTVDQCLDRNPEWTKYHAETLAEQTETPAILEDAIDAADVERTFLRFCAARQFAEAAGLASQLAGKNGTDRRYQGWLLQLAGRAALYAGNAARAEEYQRRAYLANNLLAPPKASIPYEPIREVGTQVHNLLQGIAKFALRKGFLQAFDEITSWLTPAATSNQFEEAMKKLGKFLGFGAQRPEREYRAGPDVLWLDDSKYGFVIECKSQKEAPNPLTKAEHGQLLTAVEWFRGQYPNREPIRIIVHPNDSATRESAAAESYALTSDSLGRLTTALRLALDELCSSYAEMKALERPCALMLEKHGLTSKGIAENFLTKFRALEQKRRAD